MMFEADVMEFPGFADLPKREKSKVHRVWDAFRELSNVSGEKGLLVTQSVVARLLDISRQRVHDLVKEGRLETYVFEGVPLVTEKSLVAFAQVERKTGRPCKIPVTIGECLRRAKGSVK